MEVAGANRRWRCQFRYRGSRHESAVAQLFSLGIMRRVLKITAIIAGALSVLSLILLMFSYHDGGPRPQLTFKIPPFVSIGFYNGRMMADRRQHPYSESLSHVQDGFANYEGGVARARKDWDWYLGSYSFTQVRYFGEKRELVAKDRFLLLPGVYYRHFEWEQEPVLWTIGCSLLYPTLLPVVLPLLFVVRSLRRRKDDA